MTNPVCDLLKIQVPILSGGMVWCSGWKLVVAVSRCKGLGLLGAGSMRPDVLSYHISRTQSEVQGGYGVNLPVFSKYADEIVEVILKHKVPIVVCSAGSPKRYTSRLKDAGVIVGHVVPSASLAVKCEQAGVDFVVCEGFEAGGHNGLDEITTFCLIPQVRRSISLPLVAAGGIATGQQILAALALGADGVQIGTRFACTKESSAHENFKQAIMAAQENTTVLTLKKLMPVRLAKNSFYEKIRDLELKQQDSAENLSALLGTGRARKGIFEGDLQEGELEFGQCSALISSCPSVADVMEEFRVQYEEALLRMRPLSWC